MVEQPGSLTLWKWKGCVGGGVLLSMPRKLTLLSHGKTVQVGNFLGPRERLSFAQTLRAALNAARDWHPA